jgi:hypothetical protein
MYSAREVAETNVGNIGRVWEAQQTTKLISSFPERSKVI